MIPVAGLLDDVAFLIVATLPLALKSSLIARLAK